MNIPKKVKIGPHIYKIKYVKDLNHDHDIVGQSLHLRGTIKIDPDQSISQQEDTFIHEILHAIDEQTKFTESDRSESEKTIQRLSPLFLSIIKDNPDIFKK